MSDIMPNPLGDPDQQVWDGVQALLDSYAHITRDDNVIIAYTLDVRDSAAWVALALEQREIPTLLVPMLPLRDQKLCRRLSELIPLHRETTGRCVLMLLEWETVSHDEIIRQTFSHYETNQYLVVRVINAGCHLFANGMAITPEELAARNTTLWEYCRSASSLTVTTPRGTDLKIELDPSKFRWLSMCGITHPGKALVLPTGEIATFPATISGRLVADFALQANFRISGDTRLNKRPVTIEVKDSEVIDYQCNSTDIMNLLDRAFAHKNARRVGELGFGTNSQVKIPVFENSPLNERCPGVHLGFGKHNRAVGDVGYECEIHLDLIARGGVIRADSSGECIDLANIKPSLNWHSLHLGGEHEDIFSPPLTDADCCGVLV